MANRPLVAALIVLAASGLQARDYDWDEAKRPSVIYQPVQPTFVRYGGETIKGAVEGDYIKQPTFWNLTGNLIVNFTPAAPIADMRDFTANLKKSWETNFHEHKKDMALAAMGFIPIAGESHRLKAALEAGKQLRLARQIEQTVVKFAPALESGITRKLQNSIMNSLKPGEFIAVRKRAYGANFLDGKLPAKAAGDVAKISYKNGVRELLDGRKVISDLDLAFMAKHGKTLPESYSLKIGEKINSSYGHDVVMHGDNWNGARRGIEKAISIEKNPNEMVYIFNRDGFVDAGNYKVMLRRYTDRR